MKTFNHRDAAESLALEALSFLACDPDRIGRFLTSAGIGPDQLRQVAREPGFLAAVLDHLLADEPLLLTFAEESGIAPGSIPVAHQVLTAQSRRA